MSKVFPVLLAATFAAAGTASTLVSQAQNAANGSAGLFGATAQIARADDDDHQRRGDRHRGDRNGDYEDGGRYGQPCNNGNTRHGRGRNGNCGYGNGSYGNGGASALSGCVTSGVYNGNLVNFQTNANGQITVNEQQLINSGRGLSLGQCTTIRGYWSGNVFNAASGATRGYGRNGGYGGGYGGPYGYGGACVQSVSGWIVMVSGTMVTINKGLITGTTQFDASQAINSGRTNGNLSIGRRITACGYTDAGGFHAVSIQ